MKPVPSGTGFLFIYAATCSEKGHEIRDGTRALVSKDEMRQIVTGTGWRVARFFVSKISVYIAMLEKETDMNATTYATAAAFLDAAGEWLEREEPVNNLILGLAGRLATTDKPPDPPVVMLTVSGPAGLEAATIMTPPHGVVLYAPAIGTDREDQATAALEVIAEALQAGGHTLPECHGPSATALAFAKIWAERTGKGFALKMAQRIYELREVTFPRGVPGQLRVSRADDLELLAEWIEAFSQVTLERLDAQAAMKAAQQAVAYGSFAIWEDGARAVSMAAARRPTRRGISIGSVYTPPEHRGHGYASACVAALSQRQLDAGREFCCLYTDLANPTSNSIYQKIGYVPVADSGHYVFDGKSEHNER